MALKGLRLFIFACVTFGLFCSPAAAKTKHKRHSPSAVPDNTVIARWCRLAYYDFDAAHKPGQPAKYDSNGQTKRQKMALLYLGTLPKDVLRKRAMRLVKSEPTGSYTYDAAAFTLAYYGIDENPNTRRVVRGWTRHWQDPETDPIGEDVTGNLLMLCLRYPRETTFGSLFYLHTDGAATEAKYLCVQTLMKRKPKVMLRFCGKRGDACVKKLSTMLRFEGTPKYVRPLLKRMRKDRDGLTATTAARLAKEMGH